MNQLLNKELILPENLSPNVVKNINIVYQFFLTNVANWPFVK